MHDHAIKQLHACGRHNTDTSAQLIRALCVHILRFGNIGDLADIVERWDRLGEDEKTSILEIVTPGRKGTDG